MQVTFTLRNATVAEDGELIHVTGELVDGDDLWRVFSEVFDHHPELMDRLVEGVSARMEEGFSSTMSAEEFSAIMERFLLHPDDGEE